MSETIRILVDNVRAESNSKSALPSIEDLFHATAGKAMEVEIETLSQQVAAAYGKVVKALSALPENEAFALQSVAFTLSLDATGAVSLVSAASGSIKTQTGLSFIISRKVK